MGGGEILKKGLLIKSPPLDSGVLKVWHKRWFVLLSSKVLEYYKTEGGELKGVINLEYCHSINCNLSHKRYKHVFNIETKERVYFLVAKSQLEMDVWVEALCNVCGLHTANTAVIATRPSSSSSKNKGPVITQPIYSTYTLATANSYAHPVADSVYSLAAANSECGLRKLQDYAGSSTGVPVSEARGSMYNRESATSGGSGVWDQSENRLSETAFFSPRPGDNLSYLETEDSFSGLRTGQKVSLGRRAVSKAKAATLASSVVTDTMPSGLKHRSHTNAVTNGGKRLFSGSSNSCVPTPIQLCDAPGSADKITQRLHSPMDTPVPHLDQASTCSEEGYGVLSMPPPIDRSRKPQQGSSPKPHREGQELFPLSKSTQDGTEFVHHWCEHEATPTSLHETGIEGMESEIVKDEDQESQFNISEIPQVTVCTTHYTQVDFNPDTRRPIPLPRKTSSASSTPTSLVPKSQRVSYMDIDLHATSQLSDRLHRQMTVREAERKALAEREYVNIDHSGTVDDETDPDYYTHMRDLNFDDGDEPHYFSVQLHQKQTPHQPVVEESDKNVQD